MATQAISIERRQHPREGILGQLENITYTILRRYGIPGEATREAVSRGMQQRVSGAVQNDISHQEPVEPARLPVASAISRICASQENEQNWLRKEGTTMTANLVIVLSNPQPNRERRYPSTWLLYTQGQDDPVEVQVEHDSHTTPHVLNKVAV